MRYRSFILILLLSPAFASGADDSRWRSLADPDKFRPGSRDLFSLALTVCREGRNLDRLDHIFTLLEKMQDRDPKSKTYGNFRWYWTNDTVMDLNAVDFCLENGSLIWLQHRDKLPPAARDKLHQLLELGLEGARRQKVASSYTNISILNAQCLILTGEGLDKPEFIDEGYKRLDALFEYTRANGVHEYNSPTYYMVDLNGLEKIIAHCKRDSGKRQAMAMLELIWTDIAANWFPAANRLGGSQSRTYDYLHGLGGLEQRLIDAGWSSGARHPQPDFWPPPKTLLDLNRNQFPRLVRQSWGDKPEQFRTHYLCKDVTLGSSAAYYGGRMDMPLTFDFASTEPKSVRGYFIADGRHDPYGKVKIPAGPHEKCFHSECFWTAAQQKTDALGFVAYRSNDLKDSTTLESHIVLPKSVDAIWINDKPVTIASGATIPLQPTDVLILRKGTAAVGIRIPWTCAASGSPASIALVDDANTYDALRLTVDHHLQDRKPKVFPSAAFWLRLGSGLTTDSAFESWRKSFASAKSSADGSPTTVMIKVDGTDGPLSITATEPFVAAKSTIDPPPARVVLEINGKDVGRQILNAN